MAWNGVMAGRATWIDGMRLLAGVSMVGLHASSDAAGLPFAAWEPADRVAPVAFRTVVYMARTELFIIVSLFLLFAALDRRPRTWGAMAAEQARRLLVPFAFWTLFYAFYRLIKASWFGYAGAIRAELAEPAAWLGYALLGDVTYHMHFLPTLFPLVLMVPLYRVAIDRPVLGLGVLACLMAKRELDVWLWSNHAGMAGFDYLVRAVKVATYAGYGLAAASLYGLLTRGSWGRHGRAFATAAVSLGVVLVVCKVLHARQVIETGTWQFNHAPGYWGDFLMPLVLFAIAASLRDRAWPAVFTRLAPLSFGLYLVHPLFLDLAEIAVDGRGLAPGQMVAVKVALTLAGAALAVRALARSRWLGWTIGLGPVPVPRISRPAKRGRWTKPPGSRPGAGAIARDGNG